MKRLIKKQFQERRLKFMDKNAEQWSFQVEEVSGSGTHDVEAGTMEAVMKKAGFDRIDILKLDMEGSEKELFSENYDVWMDKVNVIVIELHDRKKMAVGKLLFQPLIKKMAGI